MPPQPCSFRVACLRIFRLRTAPTQAAQEIAQIVRLRAAQAQSAGETANRILDEIGRALEEQTEEKIKNFLNGILQSDKLLYWVKLCLSGILVLPKNPFVPGLILSLIFSREAENAPEGEQKILLSLQTTVDMFLVEVLERLPQTVQGCEGCVNCDDLFAPNGVSPSPLQMMVDKRKQRLIFCKVPLVMNYLSNRFWKGLPGLLDTGGILEDRKQLENLAKRDFVLGTKGTI